MGNDGATKRSDAVRDEVLRRKLKMPPKENKELKTGTHKTTFAEASIKEKADK